MKLIKETERWAFFAHYDEMMEVWDIYLDSDGESFIGICEDIPQALRFIDDWIKEQ